MIFQFKINLKNVGIPVWRRLLVDSRTTFEEFHYILMAAFDWTGGHLHEFDVRKTDGTNLPLGEERIVSNIKNNIKKVRITGLRKLLVDSQNNIEKIHFIFIVVIDWTGRELQEFLISKTDGTNLPFGEVLIGSNNNINGAEEDVASNFFIPF